MSEIPDEGHGLDSVVGNASGISVLGEPFHSVRLQKTNGIDISVKRFTVKTANHRFFGGRSGQLLPLFHNRVSNISALIVSLARCLNRLRLNRGSCAAKLPRFSTSAASKKDSR